MNTLAKLGREYRTPWEWREKARLRRIRLRELLVCINGIAHGPATHGVRCKHCHEVHRKSASPHQRKVA